MGKGILWLCILVLLGVGVWYGVRQWKATRHDTDGAVVCVENCDTPEQKARFAAENRGDTADGNSERKQHTAAQEAVIAAGFPGGPGAVSSNDLSQSSQPLQPGQGYGNNQVVPNVVTPGNKPGPGNTYGDYVLSDHPAGGNFLSSNNAPENTMGNRQIVAPPVGSPLAESRSPNAPNDLHFTGSGSYQWYRQGNLTWRVDTSTGRSCIIYATMEEWKKQIVYRHGCGSGA